MVKVFAAVLVVCVVMIVIFQTIDPQVNKGNSNISQTSLIDDKNSINVTISGEITRPGTYVLDANTTLADLISTANGVTTNADEKAYDVTYILSNSLSFYIAPKYDNNDVCSTSPIKKASINDDDAEKMQEISGIGATVSKAIVEYRTTNGKFQRIEDIKNVNGIGNATFEKIKNYIKLVT